MIVMATLSPAPLFDKARNQRELNTLHMWKNVLIKRAEDLSCMKIDQEVLCIKELEIHGVW